MIPRTVVVTIAFVLLAAHFLRNDNYLVVVLCLIAPLALLIKKRRARLLVQWLLYLGAAVWLHTTLVLTHARMAAGTPWTRMLVILGVVTLFTLYAGLLLNSAKVKKRYP